MPKGEPAGRTRRIRLQDNTEVSTPLLIPSLSTKGSGVDRDGAFEISYDYEVVKDSVTEALLVSAYDVHYGHLPSLGLGEDRPDAAYRLPSLLVVDSGGYETTPFAWDASEVMRSEVPRQSWEPATHDKVVAGLPGDANLMIVNYDCTRRYGEQVAAAQAFFAKRPDALADFLVKPPDRKGFLEPKLIRPHLADMRAFDVLGVTEKELGDTIMARLVCVAELRRALDEEQIDVPIHVFGSLDPTFTPLYFMAGAEIFDGLTWLRYSYREGLSIYGEARAVLEQDLDRKADQRKALVHLSNLAELGRMKTNLERWATEHDFDVFEPSRRPAMLHAYKAMVARLNVGRRT